MSNPLPSVLKLKPLLYPRPWGGERLLELYGGDAATAPVGEAWLAADHPHGESEIEGRDGETLQDWMRRDADALIGAGIAPAKGGRFPVLLKMLHATRPLSVQVHPDDPAALRLQEPDGGKTEMWHIVEAEDNASVLRGFQQETSSHEIRDRVEAGTIQDALTSVVVKPGDSVFVPATTVHAIGGGLLLAEIQQNSDVTYRMSAIGVGVGSDGKPRELHTRPGDGRSLDGSSHSSSEIPDAGLPDYQSWAISIVRSYWGPVPFFIAERWRVDDANRSESLPRQAAGGLCYSIRGEVAACSRKGPCIPARIQLRLPHVAAATYLLRAIKFSRVRANGMYYYALAVSSRRDSASTAASGQSLQIASHIWHD